QMAYLNDKASLESDLIRFDYMDREEMFDVVSYQKGSRVLHMLRKTIGDEAFFKALNLYLTRHAYKTAEIHELRLCVEEVTGRDMNWFFNQWFLNSGHPVIQVESIYMPDRKEVQLIVKQAENAPLFSFPVQVDVYANGSRLRKEILVSKQSQVFYLQADV